MPGLIAGAADRGGDGSYIPNFGLRALGGEYAAIAALAPALPMQRRIEEAAQEEEKRRSLAEAEAEEEDE